MSMTAAERAVPWVTSAELARRCRASYRQVHYWAQRGLLRCQDTRPGSGQRRMHPVTEVAVADALAVVSEVLFPGRLDGDVLMSIGVELRRLLAVDPDVGVAVVNLSPDVSLVLKVRRPK